MSKPVVLPSRAFPTRAAAKAYFRDLHNTKYVVGEVVSDPSDIQLLRELVQHHPRADEKIGSGIAAFFIAPTSRGDRNFVRPSYTGIWIRDVEGHERDFSYNTAIDEPTERAIVKEALRNEVEDLRVSVRERAFDTSSVVCARTGDVLHHWSEAAVVYEAPSWDALTTAFSVAVGGWSALETTSGDGGVMVGRLLRDRLLAQRWREFWEAHAAPRIVSKRALG